MITLADYFDPKEQHPEVTEVIRSNAIELLGKVNPLLARAELECGYDWPVDPDTGTCVSGSAPRATKSGDGGFRLSTSKTGGAGSKHRTAQAIDVYDPGNVLDKWLTDDILAEHGLYREGPSYTPGWCHLQSVGPRSGRRTYDI